MLTSKTPLRVAVLCSHRAPGIDALLQRASGTERWDIVCAITTELPMKDDSPFVRSGIPLFTHPIRQFHQQCGAPLRNLEVRRSFDALTVHVLQQLDIDAVLLLGYLYVATDVLLTAFPDRVFNVHDSDLALENEYGARRYIGLHSTRDAIAAGESETRSTLHLVTPALDGGPIIFRSRAYPVAPFVHEAARAGYGDIVKAYAYAQREWMMRDSWGHLAAAALDQLAGEAPFADGLLSAVQTALLPEGSAA